MPQLGFKKQFVPAIKAGTKKHTIRAKRKHPFRVGDRLFMYSDMRQKSCEKIGEVEVSKVERITIFQPGACAEEPAVFIQEYLNDERQLSAEQIEALAIADGFGGIAGTTATEAFFWFFANTHGAEFRGFLIHWKNFQPAKP